MDLRSKRLMTAHAMIAATIRWLVQLLAVGAVVVFAINFIGVVFFGGINLQVGEIHVRSTTIEFPLFGLLISGLVWLVISGRTKESLLLFCSLIFALIVVEIGLRIADHPLSRPQINFNLWYEPSALYEHQLVKNFDGLGPLQVPVKTNAHGFRDVDHRKDKGDRTIRVLGLGDSFTFGYGVPIEKTYLKQLEVILSRATGLSAEVFNTGVPGWGLNQYYICLKEFGVQFAPDIVVVGYWPDDLTGPPADRLGAVPNSTWEAEGRIKMRGGPLQHIRIFNFFVYLADQVKYKNRSTRIPHLHDPQARRAEWTKNPDFLLADPGQEITAMRSRLLKEHLSRINRLVTNNGASLILVFIPDYSQLFHPEFQHINRVIESTARELGIVFLDMTPIYEATETSRPNYLWPLDAHTNEVGHQAIAEALMPIVCRHLDGQHIPCYDAPIGSSSPSRQSAMFGHQIK